MSELVVGTNDGSLYFFNNFGDHLKFMDMPLDIPVLGLKCQATLILAWDFQGVYRFHNKRDEIAPFIFKSGRCMGVSGCGSLICTLNEFGSTWISNTFSSGLGRQVLAPKSLRLKEEDKEDFLIEPVSYQYQAICLTRTKLLILYPCGVNTKFELIQK
jgi:hypothetical protein